MVHHTLKGCPHISDAEYLAKLKRKCKVTERGCWEWQGFKQPTTGYADMAYRGKTVRIHRLAYMLAKGAIPDDLCVLHSCDVRHCCNPDHLRLGTISENKQDELQRGRNFEANRTHCPRGHAYADHGVPQGRKGWRHCSICQRGRQRMLSGLWSEEEAYSAPPIPATGPKRRRAASSHS